MKKIIKYLCIAFYTASSFTGSAMDLDKLTDFTYFDTLKITIDSSVFVTLSTLNLQNLNSDNNSTKFDEVLGSFQKNLPTIVEGIPNLELYEIIYEYGKSVIVEEKELNYSYAISNGELRRKENFSTCLIIGHNFNMLIEFSDLQQLLKTDFETKIMQAMNQLPQKERKAKTYQITIHRSNLEFNRNKIKANGEIKKVWSNFSLINVGSGILKNQLYVDIKGEFALGFSKKGFKRHQFVLAYNYIPIFTEDYSVEPYGFADICYKLNTSWNYDMPFWVGLEYGYLVKKGGDFLEKNTQRIGISVPVGESLNVSTQYYFPGGGLKKAYPGLRFELDF